MAGILPWHAAAWERLMGRKAADRMPHGLLVSGPEGIGKGAFVDALAAALLCERGPGAACGQCDGCRQHGAGAHPDYGLWAPEEGTASIKVDQVRELTAAVVLTRARAAYKVGVLRPAEAMTREAANSLLKTLEEPPPQTVLVLVSRLPGQLPATIRSRCQQVPLAPCYDAVAVTWLVAQGLEERAARRLLALAGGAPLRAAALAAGDALEEGRRVAGELAALTRRASDPVTVAERWAKAGLGAVLPWLQGTVQDAIRHACHPTAAAVRYGEVENPGRILSFSSDLPLLFEIDARLTRLAAALVQRHNVSPNSLAEQIAVPLYRGGAHR